MNLLIPNFHDSMIKVRKCRFSVLGFTGERLHRGLDLFFGEGGKDPEGWIGIFYPEGRVS